MARSNSPGYPSMSLPKAISAARKIFEADRRNPIDRATAAKHIGYAGPSGASDKALAALGHYGLTEKTGKSEIRVSQLALDIIHPDPSNPSSEARAIYEAAMTPQVFKDLRARFPDHVSEDSLKSYLIREGFQNVAINPLSNAYFDTFRFLEQSKVFESGGIGGPEEEESDQSNDDWTDEMDETTTLERPQASVVAKPTPSVAPAAPAALNRIDMDIKGDQVHLNALLDHKGLLALEKKIAALKLLLEVAEQTAETSEDEKTDDG